MSYSAIDFKFKSGSKESSVVYVDADVTKEFYCIDYDASTPIKDENEFNFLVAVSDSPEYYKLLLDNNLDPITFSITNKGFGIFRYGISLPKDYRCLKLISKDPVVTDGGVDAVINIYSSAIPSNEEV